MAGSAWSDAARASASPSTQGAAPIDANLATGGATASWTVRGGEVRIDDILAEDVSRPGDQSRGAGSDRKASFFGGQRAGRETSGLTTKARRGLARQRPCTNWPIAGSGLRVHMHASPFCKRTDTFCPPETYPQSRGVKKTVPQKENYRDRRYTEFCNRQTRRDTRI